MAGRKLVVEIVGDSRSLERAFDRSGRAAKGFQAQVTGISRGLGMGGFLGIAGGVTAAAAGLGLAFRTGFSEMRESRKVAAQTGAAIKSTGGVAGVTAGHVSDLADQLMHLSAVDDEVIQQGENVLLTFTNLRNGVSRGNDIFDQATKAALDLSVRMGTDLQSAALQVGKALQDPVRGMTALRRAGVSFTEAQQKTIRRLVESNRLMDAQKLILQELNTEFGGSAAAAGEADGGISRLGHTIENFLGTVVEQFMPAIEQATARLQEWFDDPRNVQRVTDDVRGFAGAIADTTSAIRGGVNDINEFFEKAELVSAKGTLALVQQFKNVTGVGGDMVDQLIAEIAAQEAALAASGKAAGDAWANGFATAGLRAKDIIEGRQAAGGLLPPTDFEVPAPDTRKGVTQAQRNKWWDAMIGRKQERAKSIADLQEIVRMIEARIKITKDITRRMKLQDELWRTQQEIAAKAAQIREDRRETQMGWLEFAIERAEATDTVKDDLKAWRAMEAALLERIRQEGRTLDLMRDLWRARERIRDLNKKKAATDPMAGLMQASTKRLTDIIGAGTGANRQVLAANISGLQMRPIYVAVQMDGREVGRAVTTQQARTGKRTARQTSGSR